MKIRLSTMPTVAMFDEHGLTLNDRWQTVETDKLGRAVGSEVEINTAGIGAQTRTSIAVSPFGPVLLPWEGYTGSPNAPVISARRVQL